jgi:hypothetical protein
MAAVGSSPSGLAAAAFYCFLTENKLLAKSTGKGKLAKLAQTGASKEAWMRAAVNREELWRPSMVAAAGCAPEGGCPGGVVNVPAPADVRRASVCVEKVALESCFLDNASDGSERSFGGMLARRINALLGGALPPEFIAAEMDTDVDATPYWYRDVRPRFWSRPWAMHRYLTGDFFARHTDSRAGPDHIGTTVLIPPASQMPFEGGELRVWAPPGGGGEEEDLLISVTQHATDPTFVFIPLGCPHEVLPVTAGVRVALTAPLLLPEAVLRACAEQVHREPVPVAGPEDSLHATARKQLRKKIAEREKAMAALQKEIAALRAEEEALAGMRGETPTTLAIASQSLRPPFAAMLYNFYPGAPAPQRFTPQDAATYNWILRAFPCCEVRVLNVAYHLPDAGHASRSWRDLLATSETGWLEPDTELGEDEERIAQRNAHRLRDVRLVYGYSELPGQVVGHSSIYNDEGHDYYDNFAMTVLHVSERPGVREA